MIKSRSNGILCHISSLPSAFGVGDLGPQAYKFVDFLAATAQKWWQVLPLSPTDRALGNSPYSSYSAFAFNTLFISPELLVKEGYCLEDDVERLRGPFSGEVDFESVYSTKAALVEAAFSRYQRKGVPLKAFDDFCLDQSSWLEDFALFLVLKKSFADACWVDWPAEFRDRHAPAIAKIRATRAADIKKQKFAQFLFFDQWMRLKAYCRAHGVGIIGDIPIYVNYDSVDVWAHPELFKLDADKRQTFVAGVPPDYFSAEGQRWGNPVYDWEALEASGFSFWVDRIRHNLAFFDSVRIDHFRAFAQCWEIPVDEKTAINGLWCDVPGVALFKKLNDCFKVLPIIAEDLGIITPDVDALKQQFSLPGMRVVMFAFHNQYRKSRDLPENFTPDSVVYTGTHDNNTVRGWFEEDMTESEKSNFLEYFGFEPPLASIEWIMISMAMKSAASICIIPLQDILGLNSKGRMNRPSTTKGNWRWRFREGDIHSDVAGHLKRLTVMFDR